MMALTEEHVLAYLDAHPGFIDAHASRLLAHADKDRTVVSFAQHQMRTLKARIDLLEQELAGLLDCAQQNETLLARMHLLATCLLSAGDTASLIARAKSTFSDAFGLPACAILLFDNQQPAGGSRIPALAAGLDEPYCGPYAMDEVLALFPPAPVWQSFALVALRQPDGTAFGLLAFASEDPVRFDYDMQTLYLARIGEMMSAALWRTMLP